MCSSDTLIVLFAVQVTSPDLWSVRDAFWDDDDDFSSRAKEIVSLSLSLSLSFFSPSLSRSFYVLIIP